MNVFHYQNSPTSGISIPYHILPPPYGIPSRFGKTELITFILSVNSNLPTFLQYPESHNIYNLTTDNKTLFHSLTSFLSSFRFLISQTRHSCSCTLCHKFHLVVVIVLVIIPLLNRQNLLQSYIHFYLIGDSLGNYTPFPTYQLYFNGHLCRR